MFGVCVGFDCVGVSLVCDDVLPQQQLTWVSRLLGYYGQVYFVWLLETPRTLGVFFMDLCGACTLLRLVNSDPKLSQ